MGKKNWETRGKAGPLSSALYPESLDASPGDLLAVIEFYPLKAVTALQVLQGCVGD